MMSLRERVTYRCTPYRAETSIFVYSIPEMMSELGFAQQADTMYCMSMQASECVGRTCVRARSRVEREWREYPVHLALEQTVRSAHVSRHIEEHISAKYAHVRIDGAASGALR